MSRRTDQQAARGRRSDGLTKPRLTKRERRHQAELLIADVLNTLSHRDTVVEELERRAGRGLAEIKTLGWPSSLDTAQACGLSLREAARLRGLVRDTGETANLPAPDPAGRSEVM